MSSGYKGSNGAKQWGQSFHLAWLVAAGAVSQQACNLECKIRFKGEYALKFPDYLRQLAA